MFISYRRSDSAAFAGRLADFFDYNFQGLRVFFDLVAIEPGQDFVEAIRSRIASSEVVLVMMGPQWLGATDDSGQRRLDNPADFVRLEVASALSMGARVIPVLLDEAQMPGEHDLPDDLKALARCNAQFIRGAAFKRDAEHLGQFVNDFLAQSTKTITAPAQAPQRQAGSAVKDGLLSEINTYIATAVPGSFVTIESAGGNVVQFAWDGADSDIDTITMNLPFGGMSPDRIAIARQLLTEAYASNDPIDDEDYILLSLPADGAMLTRVTLDIFEHVFDELPDVPFSVMVEV
ncbi:MAG: toll/interleukin-1 receptor domain-containing protein [Pseudomonadota bacterium]